MLLSWLAEARHGPRMSKIGRSSIPIDRRSQRCRLWPGSPAESASSSVRGPRERVFSPETVPSMVVKRPAEVQRRLALSKSQYYRDHEAALGAVAELLWHRLNGVRTERAKTSRVFAAVRWSLVAGGVLVLAAVIVFAGDRGRRSASTREVA